MSPTPSFGPGADLTPISQRARASSGTKHLPTSFVFDEKVLSEGFSAFINRLTHWHISPNTRVNDNVVATTVIGILLFYCQWRISPEVRMWVLSDLRTSGRYYDGDLLEELVHMVNRGSPRAMRDYLGEGWGAQVDELYRSGGYYTADGLGCLYSKG